MTRRPVQSSVALVALILTFLFVGCAKEEPPPPTADSAARSTPTPGGAGPGAGGPGAGGPLGGQAAADFQNQDIYFDFDKYDLRADARATLDRKVAFMNQNASVRAQVEGHCDERGTNAYNLALGERRANAAKQYMTTAGVTAARLTTISYGEERPIDPGHTEAAWAKNRRAHFVITGQ
ncbi:MAG: peptidoglycan-associated lipoprotein Pal [Candidatus Tectomicrobia bacterium]|uniref:Peptidoglycan-associated lipoprotein n=1 Tax=Tectimicrobiota bacterium TaxID=2528274 RepID=A0A938B123_UNCTE|nr:peptidoglycan-associated lipoprotein Pal [Candidatus Tectomicrobia bacterium]